MAARLTQQRRVGDEGLRVVNPFSQGDKKSKTKKEEIYQLEGSCVNLKFMMKKGKKGEIKRSYSAKPTKIPGKKNKAKKEKRGQ